MGGLPSSAARVDRFLSQNGCKSRVREMPESTRTAKDAASAIGTTVDQIGKSLIFENTETGEAVLVIASGVNQVDVRKVAVLEGAPIKRPDADFVRARTGFAIGGVPPVCHSAPMSIYLDEDLLRFDTIWCAAGTPRTVFTATPEELRRLTGGRSADIKST